MLGRKDQMGIDFIKSEYLINAAWLDFAREAISDYDFMYRYYVHETPGLVDIGGGPYGSQSINTLELSTSDVEFLVSSIERLDSLIDLDFERTWNQSAAVSRYFLDTKIDIEGHPLGITTTNIADNQLWFEIILDGTRLIDDAYRGYAVLHEYAHTLGLEHPFDDADGDSFGGTNPWSSNIFPEDTVMAYRSPSTGQWPQWFSASDINALVEAWGLEDDSHGSYYFSRLSTGQTFMIGDPVRAKSCISLRDVVLDQFKPCEREVFGSSDDDELIGFTSEDGGWINEWFYSGAGDDEILGGGGRDQLLGGFGDDILRGGHGQDVLEGSFGDDQLYGGGGRNTLIPGSGQDSLFVLSDHISHDDFVGRNHDGKLADVLLGVQQDDKITILGCTTDELSVVTLEDGYGIQAHGVLEAVILDSDVNQSEITAMLSGDATRWY